MYRLCSLLMMFAALAEAATIVNTSVTCDGVTTSALSCGQTVPFVLAQVQVATSSFVQVETGTDPGHNASASASVQGDDAITIIGGPATGYFLPCFSVGADFFHATASASASIGAFGFGGSGNQGVSGNCSALPNPISTIALQPYTLGVTEILPFFLSASASSFSFAGGGQAGASAMVQNLAVFDSGGILDTAAVSTITEVTAAPEPTPGMFVFCGAVLLFVARRAFLRI